MIETDAERLAKAICHSRGYDPDAKAIDKADVTDPQIFLIIVDASKIQPLWRFFVQDAESILASLASDIDKDDEPELPLELPAEPESEEPHWSERMGLYETGNA